MKVQIKKLVEVEITTLHVRAGARYWEDATVDGVEDTAGDLIPCREGDDWCPVIHIETGQILNWNQGKTADIHYKVCDDGEYEIKDGDENSVLKIDGYVPKTLSPGGSGYGDYIIMKVDENGFIQNWKFNIADFTEDED